jgi:hypothetical protein
MNDVVVDFKHEREMTRHFGALLQRWSEERRTGVRRAFHLPQGG